MRLKHPIHPAFPNIFVDLELQVCRYVKLGVHEEEKNINRTFIYFEYKKKKTQIIYRTLVSLYFVSRPWFQIATERIFGTFK